MKAELSPVKTIVDILEDKTDSNGSVETPVEVEEIVVEYKNEEEDDEKTALI